MPRSPSLMVLNPSSNWVYHITAGLATLLDETLHHIITGKEWAALQRGDIGEQEAVLRIAESLRLPTERIAAPLHRPRGLISTYTEPDFSEQPTVSLDSHILRGKAWLKQNARRLLNQVEGSGFFEDTFSQFLIMEATDDISLLHLHPYKDLESNDDIRNTMDIAKKWNYFLGKPVGTTKQFPADVDTTSCALLAFNPTSGVNDVLDDMLANRNADGLVQTYWDESRPRVDICVLTNVVRTFYKYGRGAEIQESLAYISNALRSGSFASGTRHYCTPEVFLFFMSQLVLAHPYATEIQCLRAALAKAVVSRMGVYENQVTQAELDLAQAYQDKGEKYEAYVPEVDSLAIAMRILACQALELRPEAFGKDISRLASVQCDDGGWPLAWVCRYGRTKLRIGNRGVVTAYATKALEAEAAYGMMTAQAVNVAELEIDESTSE